MHTFRVTATAAAALVASSGFALWTESSTAHADQPFLLPGSLVVSSTTYDGSQGAVASLVANSTVLPGPVVAVADSNYVQVWNNANVDASFGVTSPILLTDLDPSSGHVFNSLSIPTDQVVTSFSSKSELALHVSNDSQGSHLVFVGYGLAGVGALDVSNSDAVAGQDPTNPVTALYGDNYAFHRTIVALDFRGNLSYTPTINYGGNNGRSGLLGSNGLYYTVGNANNGSASTFGAAGCISTGQTTSTLNCTSPDVTETTGLEVVDPIDGSSASVAIPANNSAEVDPLLLFCQTSPPASPPCGKGIKVDKAGKDDNYRGVTEFGGALYFTKGSGSNGFDTVYTVSTLPTLANAASTAISVVPGFPIDLARTTNGDYTPFAVFFANPSTMYVTDEGTGGAMDAHHSGLEKWSLVKGSWQLDYVLTSGLIGTVDGSLFGPDGQYPDVTTIGLRNLTGLVNAAGTVTLWATTSTSSASGDNGADPNKVVTITDQVSAMTVTPAVAAETFTTLLGPTYGTVYRGVAYVCNESHHHSDVCTAQ